MLVCQKAPVLIEPLFHVKSSFLFREISIANDNVCEDDLLISHRRYCVNTFQKKVYDEEGYLLCRTLTASSLHMR